LLCDTIPPLLKNTMSNELGRFKTYAGHLILLLLAGLLVLGWRLTLESGAGASNTIVIEPDPAAIASETEVAEPVAQIELAPPTSGELTQENASPLVLPILTDMSLAPASNPFTFQGKLPSHQFETYVVERGDTPDGIAQKFGIESETLLGGNPLLGEESSLLQTGVELLILPVNGVLHDVEPGDSLESVASLYGVSEEAIIDYGSNNLEFPFRLYPDSQILVPGAVREVFVWTPPDLATVTRNTSFEGSGVTPVVVGTGTFIYPVSARNFTQYFWYGHQAIDIATLEGSAVYASDTGTVTFAGWNTYGYGNLIVVNHGNGYETFYAHLSGINVGLGQVVFQGNLIGATGNTGRSSGPHIHFEIRINNNRDNPCWYIGC
jgi:LysM repeat protein